MRAVNLDHFESGGQRASGGGCECGGDCGDFQFGQFVRRRIALAKGNRTGGYRLPTVRLIRRDCRAALPWKLGTGFTSGVCELNTGNRALWF